VWLQPDLKAVERREENIRECRKEGVCKDKEEGRKLGNNVLVISYSQPSSGSGQGGSERIEEGSRKEVQRRGGRLQLWNFLRHLLGKLKFF